MSSPLTVRRNHYFSNKKESDISTPISVCKFLAELLVGSIEKIDGTKNVYDIGCKDGILSYFFKKLDNDVVTYGVDIESDFENSDTQVDNFCKLDFLHEDFPSNWKKASLVLCNPPFNNSNSGRKLKPELFLRRILEVFDNKTPIVLFTPMGFRLNQRKRSSRYKWLMSIDAKISSIISLPLDAFDNVEFHSEILIFNVNGIDPHYFLNFEE